MAKQAQWIKADGTATDVTPANGKTSTFEEMQRFVGGFVELIMLYDGSEMYVNEDGRRKALPVNREASYLFSQTTILGDVLVCDKGMVK